MRQSARWKMETKGRKEGSAFAFRPAVGGWGWGWGDLQGAHSWQDQRVKLAGGQEAGGHTTGLWQCWKLLQTSLDQPGCTVFLHHSNVSSNREPVEGNEKLSDMSCFWLVEDQTCCCILNYLQTWSRSVQGLERHTRSDRTKAEPSTAPCVTPAESGRTQTRVVPILNRVDKRIYWLIMSKAANRWELMTGHPSRWPQGFYYWQLCSFSGMATLKTKPVSVK